MHIKYKMDKKEKKDKKDKKKDKKDKKEKKETKVESDAEEEVVEKSRAWPKADN